MKDVVKKRQRPLLTWNMDGCDSAIDLNCHLFGDTSKNYLTRCGKRVNSTGEILLIGTVISINSSRTAFTITHHINFLTGCCKARKMMEILAEGVAEAFFF